MDLLCFTKADRRVLGRIWGNSLSHASRASSLGESARNRQEAVPYDLTVV